MGRLGTFYITLSQSSPIAFESIPALQRGNHNGSEASRRGGCSHLRHWQLALWQNVAC